jgi:hypothetical protein
MAAFIESDLDNVTRTLQGIMDELGNGKDDEMRKADMSKGRSKVGSDDTHQNMTGETEIPVEEDSCGDSKLKAVFGRAMKIFEEEAAYQCAGSEGSRSKEREPPSQVDEENWNSGTKNDGLEKWERIVKNRWDFETLEAPEKHDIEIIVEEKLDFSVDDDCQLYAWVILMNGQRRRAAMKGGIIYLLPDPPNASWDRRVQYGDISRELWEITFYVIKPFICQQACPIIASLANEQDRDHFLGLWPELFHEFEFLYWVVLAAYTGNCYRDTVNTCRTNASYYLSMGRALYNIMMLITMQSGREGDLSEEHWARILTIFGQSFLEVFHAYQAVFEPAANSIYSGYVATGM